MSSISVKSIMNGRDEVTRQQVYSKIKAAGFKAKDSKLNEIEDVITIAKIATAVGVAILAITLFTSGFKHGGALALGGALTIAGVGFWGIGLTAKDDHMYQKMNRDKVNKALENIRGDIGRKREVQAAFIQEALERADRLKRQQDSIKVDEELQANPNFNADATDNAAQKVDWEEKEEK